jgi:hypothetical protein
MRTMDIDLTLADTERQVWELQASGDAAASIIRGRNPWPTSQGQCAN